MITLIIPRITPSNNILIRKNWRYRHQLLKTWEQEVRVFVYEFDRDNPNYFKEYNSEERKKVKIVSYRKKLCDPDNFIGGLKVCIDALVLNGLILDDSEKYIVLDAKQEKDSKNQRTEITISSCQ